MNPYERMQIENLIQSLKNSLASLEANYSQFAIVRISARKYQIVRKIATSMIDTPERAFNSWEPFEQQSKPTDSFAIRNELQQLRLSEGSNAPAYIVEDIRERIEEYKSQLLP